MRVLEGQPGKIFNARPSNVESCVFDFTNSLAENPVVFRGSRKAHREVSFSTRDAQVCIVGNELQAQPRVLASARALAIWLAM